MIRPHHFLCASLIMLTACGGKPAPDLYVLRASQAEVAQSCASGRTLTVEKPIAGDEYNSKRIAVRTSPTQLTYYTGANWASPLPNQLQDSLIEGLEKTGAFASVNDVGEDNVGMISAIVKIRAVEVVNVDAPSAYLRLNVTLLDSDTGRLIARVAVNETVAATANHMPEIVAAFNQATANAASKIAAAATVRCGKRLD